MVHAHECEGLADEHMLTYKGGNVKKGGGLVFENLCVRAIRVAHIFLRGANHLSTLCMITLTSYVSFHTVMLVCL